MLNHSDPNVESLGYSRRSLRDNRVGDSGHVPATTHFINVLIRMKTLMRPRGESTGSQERLSHFQLAWSHSTCLSLSLQVKA